MAGETFFKTLKCLKTAHICMPHISQRLCSMQLNPNLMDMVLLYIVNAQYNPHMTNSVICNQS